MNAKKVCVMSIVLAFLCLVPTCYAGWVSGESTAGVHVMGSHIDTSTSLAWGRLLTLGLACIGEISLIAHVLKE